MILITVGISDLPFDRLIAAADALATGGEMVVAQYGAARVRPQRAVCFDYLPFVELQEWVSKARVVVCHAGVGSLALCLSTGRHPVVVPRLKRLRECIDEHQLTFGRRLAELGLITLIEDISDLAVAVRSAPTRQRRTGLSSGLADELVAYIGSHAAAGDRPPWKVDDPGELEP